MSDLVIATRYDDEGRSVNTFVEVETNEAEIDIIVNPFTLAAETFSLDADEAWKLVRKIATAAALSKTEDTVDAP